VRVMHIILEHDEHIVCGNKKCKNKVLITPVDTDGIWSCPKCNRSRRIVQVEQVSVVKDGEECLV